MEDEGKYPEHCVVLLVDGTEATIVGPMRKMYLIELEGGRTEHMDERHIEKIIWTPED